MLPSFAGGGGGVFDGRSSAGVFPAQISSGNYTTIRLDSLDPEQKRIKEDLVVRQDNILPI
jgi:hypothetical protein